MDRATEFIQLFNQVSDHLREVTGLDNSVPFSQLVDRASQKVYAVQRAAMALKDYGDLRNAIVHHRDYPAVVIAEPTEAALARFSGLVDQIVAPRHLIPTFQRNITTFDPRQPLASALKHMSESDFSQVVVVKDGHLALMTSEGISRWLGQRARDDIISVAEATVGDILASEPPGNFLVMGRNHTIHDAEEAFLTAIERKQPQLAAIIVTQNGKPDEKPLGIVTPWDLLDDG